MCHPHTSKLLQVRFQYLDLEVNVKEKRKKTCIAYIFRKAQHFPKTHTQAHMNR